MKKRENKTKKYLLEKIIFPVLFILPVLAFLGLIIRYSTNVPLADDFYTILSFLDNYSHAAVFEKIALLFAQHNEHRLVFNRLLTVAADKLSGGIDFRLLLLLGGVLIIILVASLFLIFKEKKEKIKYFFPVLLIILQPQYAGAIFWATSALQNAGVLVFTALCLYFLEQKRSSDVFRALPFAVLAVFSAANGLFLLPVGALLYFMTGRKLEGTFWLAFSGLLLLLYFYSYTLPAHAGAYYSLTGIFNSALFFLTLLGSAFLVNFRLLLDIFGRGFANYFTGLAAFFGSAMLAWIIFLVKRKYYEKNPAVFYFIVILLITALATALTRGGAGILQAMTSRYRIISVLMLALLYISVLEQAAERKKAGLFRVILTAAAVFWIVSYGMNIGEISACKTNLEKGISSWMKNGQGLELLNEPVSESDAILKRALENGHYNLSGIPVNR